MNLVKLMTTVLSGGVPTVTLPQYLTSSAPVLTEDFETVGDWTALTGSRAANTTQFKSGTQSIKTTAAAGTSGAITKTVNYDLSAMAAVRVWVYVHDLADTVNIQVYLSNDAGFTNYFLYTALVANLHAGWNALQILKADFTTGGGAPTWASAIVRLRVRISATATKTPSASWDKLEVLTALPTPAVCITFDDGYNNWHTAAYAYCAPRRVRCTGYVRHDTIDSGGSWITTAQLQEMYAGGWDFGLHGDNTDLTTVTQAAVEAILVASKAALDSRGLTRADRHVAYRGGAYNDTVLLAMAAQSMLTGRTILTTRPPFVPPGDNYTIELAMNVINTTTLAQVKAKIDAAIASGTVCMLLFHSLVSSPSIPEHWAITDFQALIDYILQVKIQPITITQYYALQSGSAIVQQPVW